MMTLLGVITMLMLIWYLPLFLLWILGCITIIVTMIDVAWKFLQKLFRVQHK